MAEFGAAVATWAQGSALTVAQSALLQTVAQAAFTVAYTAYNLNQAQRAKRAARDAALASLQDRSVAIRSSDEPQAIIVGEAKVGGVIAYAKPHVDKGEYMTIVQVVAGHECERLQGIFVNDLYIAADAFDADGWVLPGVPYYKVAYDNRVESHVCPAPGGTIVLSGLPAVIDSIAYRDSQVAEGAQVVLSEGVDYTRSGSTLTLNNAAAISETLVITYRVAVGGPLLRVKWFPGTSAGARDTDLEAASGGEWTSAHVGKGLARVHITVKWDNAWFGQISLPNFAPVVRGAKFYDWATGATTWTDNAARIAAGYMMASAGFNIPGTRINADAMLVAQLACDEDVYVDASNTEKRYTADGILSTDADRRDNLRQLLSAMQGTAVYSAGSWIVRAGVYQAPTYTLTEDDLADAASIAINPAVPRRELFNSVRGRYVSAGPYFLSTSFPPYASSTYIAQDGGQQIDADIDLPFTNSAHAAQRIAKLMLHRHRLGLSWSASFKLSAWRLIPGDTVYCPFPTFGWDALNGGLGKIFRVERTSHGSDGTVLISFAEEAASVYAWNYSEATNIDPAPNTDLPDPLYVPAVSGLSATSSVTTFTKLSDGSVLPYVTLSWDAITDEGILSGGMIRILWKRAEETEWRRLSSPPDATSIRLSPLGAGEYILARVWAENGIGTRSIEVTLSHRVSTDLASAVLAAGNSANYLTNATFASGTTLWTAFGEQGFTDAFDFVQLPEGDQYRVPGLPTSVVLRQYGTQQAKLYARSAAFPVEAGRSYCVYVSLLPYLCRAKVQAEFYNAAGTLVGFYDTTAVVDSIGPTPADPSTYGLSEVRFQVAPGQPIVAARLRVEKFPTNPGSLSSALHILKPFAGPVESFASPRPEWQAGAVQTVGTSQIEPGAAAEVFDAEWSVADFTVSDFSPSTPGAQPDGVLWKSYIDWPSGVAAIFAENTHSEAATVVVSATLSSIVSINSVYARYIAGQIYTDGESLTGPEATKMAQLAPSGSTAGSLVVIRSFTIPAKTVRGYAFQLWAGAFGSGSGVPTTSFSRVRVKMHAEVIKR